MIQQKYLQTAFDKISFNTFGNRRRGVKARTGNIVNWRTSGAVLCASLVLTLFCWTGGQFVKADTLIGTVPAGSGPNAVAVNSVTNKIYVANADSNNVTVIDGGNNSTTNVAAGRFPNGVAVNSVTDRINVANLEDNNVTVIDGGNNSTTNVAAGLTPVAVAVNSATNKIYVTNADSNTVTVIDGGNNSTQTLAVGLQPIAVAVNSATNKIYVANLEGSSVTVIDGTPTPTQGFESDVAARPNGDGSILSDDVVQMRRFLNGTNTPDPLTNEFQRADSDPFATKGDGSLNSADIVQTRRYQNGTSPLQTAGGPTMPGGRPQFLSAEVNNLTALLQSAADEMRQMRVENLMTSDGQMVTVNILVNAVGDEAEYAFTLNYDESVLSQPIIREGKTTATVRACNIQMAAAIRCSVGGFLDNNPTSSEAGIGEMALGENQLLLIVEFTVRANAPLGAIEIKLSEVNAANDAPQLFKLQTTNGKMGMFGLMKATHYLQ